LKTTIILTEDPDIITIPAITDILTIIAGIIGTLAIFTINVKSPTGTTKAMKNMPTKATAEAIPAEMIVQEAIPQEGAPAVWKAGHPDRGFPVRLTAAGLTAQREPADLVVGASQRLFSCLIVIFLHFMASALGGFITKTRKLESTKFRSTFFRAFVFSCFRD
jgi:hypothetical protein